MIQHPDPKHQNALLALLSKNDPLDSNCLHTSLKHHLCSLEHVPDVAPGGESCNINLKYRAYRCCAHFVQPQCKTCDGQGPLLLEAS